FADNQPARPEKAEAEAVQIGGAGSAIRLQQFPQRADSPELSAEARCLHPGRDDDSQEAELCAQEICAGSPVQRDRGNGLYSRDRPQPPGALGGARAGWTGEGPAWCALSHCPRGAGYSRRAGSETRPLQIRNQTAEEVMKLETTNKTYLAVKEGNACHVRDRYPVGKFFPIRSSTASW